jgi:hypothetical protein
LAEVVEVVGGGFAEEMNGMHQPREARPVQIWFKFSIAHQQQTHAERHPNGRIRVILGAARPGRATHLAGEEGTRDGGETTSWMIFRCSG